MLVINHSVRLRVNGCDMRRPRTQGRPVYTLPGWTQNNKHRPQVMRLLLTASLMCLPWLSHADPTFFNDGSESSHRVLALSLSDEIVLSNVHRLLPEHAEVLMVSGLHDMPFHSEVMQAAQATQLDPALIHAVIAIESGYNPQARSIKGAFGLMQLMPATARSLTAQPMQQWSVRQQIFWGATYLRALLDMFHGDMRLALAAYNAGPNKVKKTGQFDALYAETRRYVPKVLATYQRLHARLSVPARPSR